MSREIHEPILDEYFEQVASGKKTFALQTGNWEGQAGDILILDETGTDGVSTGRSLRRKIGWTASTKHIDTFAPDDIEKHGYQIISLLSTNDLYEVSCKAILFNRDKTKVLLLKYTERDNNKNKKYGLPGGHLEYGERLNEAVRREVGEEVGTCDISDLEQAETVVEEFDNTHKMLVIFRGTIDEGASVATGEIEDDHSKFYLKWVSVEEIMSDGFDDMLGMREVITRQIDREGASR